MMELAKVPALSLLTRMYIRSSSGLMTIFCDHSALSEDSSNGALTSIVMSEVIFSTPTSSSSASEGMPGSATSDNSPSCMKSIDGIGAAVVTLILPEVNVLDFT